MLDDAEAALAPALAEIPRQLRFEALGQFLDAIRFVMTDERGTWTMAQFDDPDRHQQARLRHPPGQGPRADGRRRLDRRHGRAAGNHHARQGLGRGRAAQDLCRHSGTADAAQAQGRPAASGKTAGGIEIAGKAVAVLDPQAQMVAAYRRKLSMALN